MIPTSTPSAPPPRRRSGHGLPSGLLGVLIGLFVVATALAGYLIFASVRDFVAGLAITGDSQPQPAGSGVTQPQNGGQAAPAATPKPILPRMWTGAERVTVLVMGIDRRRGEEERGYLTDSMMLVSVDPVARTGAILSIPRDLWVEIPGYGEDTINTANRTGDYYDYPGGGPALAERTVEHNLGVPVDYYVRLDFTAFETLVDAIGGIEVQVESDIEDPYYPDGAYGYEPLYLSAGRQHLNGHDALRYARTRHDSSDIDRARRQQQVVFAVRDKVLSLNMLPTLIVKAPGLFQTLSESVWTNLTPDEIVSLALLGQEIPRESIRSAVIDYQYVLDYTTPQGRQVLVPLRDKIRDLRDELFTASAVIAAPVGTDELALMKAEAARVMVLNGAGVPGLAQATAEWLAAQGVAVAGYDTADRSDYPASVIVDYSGKPYTRRWLAQTFHTSNIISGAQAEGEYDVMLVVGQDWRVP